MLFPRGSAARFRTAVTAALVATVTLIGPAAGVAVAAATDDLSAAFNPTELSGTVGDEASFTAYMKNEDPAYANRSGPAAMTLALGGSTLVSLTSFSGTCDLATATCSYPAGLSGQGRVSINARVQLVSTGTITATAVLTGTDINPANNTATLPVTAIPPAPTALTLTATPHPVPAGGEVTLTGTLTTADGTPVPYASIRILRQAASEADFTEVVKRSTDAQGVMQVEDEPALNSTYKAVYDGSGFYSATDLAASESAPIPVTVAYGVTATTSPVAVPPGGVVTVTVEVKGSRPGRAISVQQRLGNGAWKTIARTKLGRGSKAQVQVTRLSSRGTYTYRAVAAADASHAAGSGDAKTLVTTTGRGSVHAWAPLNGTRARPVRWNPCAPIVYYVNPRRMPAYGMADLRESLRRVSMVSGLTFRYGGASSVVPTPSYKGPRGTVVIAWATPTESKGLLSPFAAGVGGFTSRRGQIMSGALVINASYLRATESGFGKGSPHGLVLMHELGHVVGLDHVNEHLSMMHPAASLPAAVWGAGDIAGLQAVGRRAGCL